MYCIFFKRIFRAEILRHHDKKPKEKKMLTSEDEESQGIWDDRILQQSGEDLMECGGKRKTVYCLLVYF